MTRERIGIAGLGRMGRAMARRLAGQGFGVTGWTRSGFAGDDAQALGIAVAADAVSLAGMSDVLILSLIDDAAVEAVLGVLAGADLAGKLVVETSTIKPETLDHWRGPLADAGAHVIDAPVSGGPEMVEAGTAGLYIGAEDGDMARFRPIAEALSGRVVHVGGPGHGYAAKIVNNMCLSGFSEVVREALLVGRSAGLELETMLAILKDSPAITPAVRGRIPHILGQIDTVGFSVDGVVKDLAVFLAVAEAGGVAIPAVRAAYDSYSRAKSRGLGDRDLSMMIRDAVLEG